MDVYNDPMPMSSHKRVTHGYLNVDWMCSEESSLSSHFYTMDLFQIWGCKSPLFCFIDTLVQILDSCVPFVSDLRSLTKRLDNIQRP